MKRTILILLLAAVVPLAAQYSYYFGQNKVIRTAFDWKVLESPHFLVYHYMGDKKTVELVGLEAERAYSRISNFLGVTIEKKTPLIFYNRQTDIEQTNLYPMIIPPGSFEGFTEPIGHRVVIYGNRPTDDLARLITHELTHSFENEILYKNRSASMVSLNRPPLWVMEGLAEFMCGEWDSFYLMTVIDQVVNDRLPDLMENGDIYGPYMTGRTPYDVGHLMFDFIYEKHGKRGVQSVMQAQRRPLIMGRSRTFLDIFNYTPKIFNYEFKKYARERFRRFMNRENPEDFSFTIAPEHPFYYSFSHQVSPSGEMLAILTVNSRASDLDIVFVSLKDGKVIKNITPGFPGKYDQIWFNFNPADGQSFCWDKKAQNIAFFARKELTYYLVLLDVASGREYRRILIENIEKPSSPVFHPENGLIYFSGVEGLDSCLYRIDPETEEIKKMTTGKAFIRAFDLSPDGKKIVYAARNGEFDKLFLAPLESPEMALQLTQGGYNDITPKFADDGKTVYYSSDELEIYNVCSLDLEKQEQTRYTDMRTGAFFPLPIPGNSRSFVISTYHKGGFYIFQKQADQFLNRRKAEFLPYGEHVLAETIAEPGTSSYRFTEEEKEFHLARNDKNGKGLSFSSRNYRPLEKIVVDALPSVAVGISTGGPFSGLDGSAYITFSDLMSDYTLQVYLVSTYGYRSYQATFFNQRRRLQYMAQIFHLGLPYIDYYTYSIFQRKITGATFGAYYPLSRSFRLQASVSFFKYLEQYYNIYTDRYEDISSLWAFPVSFSVVGDKTRFANYGPNTGYSFRLSATKYLGFGDKMLDSMVYDVEGRKYIRLDNNTLFAFRLYGYYSGGKFPLYNWAGGYNTLRSLYYGQAVGTRGVLFNAEFRFPLIQAALTPVGVIGPIRGVFFFDAGGYWVKGVDWRPFRKDEFLKFEDAISSYGFGVHAWMFGLPLHFEWAFNTNLSDWNDNRRFARFNFWIGFDF